MQDHLHIVISHTSKLQAFLGLHQIEKQVHQCQRYVEDLEIIDRAKEFNIKMKQNDVIENILIKCGLLEPFEEVIVVKTDIAMNRVTSVRREAQVQEQSNINNMTMNIEKKIEINKKNLISDMICLMDGRIIMEKLTYLLLMANLRNSCLYLVKPSM
ncbi:unnamed protein product [Mytilus coruscus]|uniref:Uncharacterized protein n=1 Tax=Mytilus coruscus TaxID=42192 RepID=A0A6J8EGC7_MYTCO|nr:unnamed protein product [Mytilus coruscus]